MIGRFRVTFCLCVKTTIRANENANEKSNENDFSPARPFSCKSNSFSFEWSRTKTRFENEAKDNSEMACLYDI